MERELGVSRVRALALASVCVDLRVTQIVNQVKGVHAVLADRALRATGQRSRPVQLIGQMLSRMSPREAMVRLWSAPVRIQSETGWVRG